MLLRLHSRPKDISVLSMMQLFALRRWNTTAYTASSRVNCGLSLPIIPIGSFCKSAIRYFLRSYPCPGCVRCVEDPSLDHEDWPRLDPEEWTPRHRCQEVFARDISSLSSLHVIDVQNMRTPAQYWASVRFGKTKQQCEPVRKLSRV